MDKWEETIRAMRATFEGTDFASDIRFIITDLDRSLTLTGKDGAIEAIEDSDDRCTTEMRLTPGTYLFYEGDEVERLYQVTRGVLRLTRLLADGRRQVIAFGYPGDIVGFPAGDQHHTPRK